MHSGTTISDLFSAAERMEARNSQICLHCNQPLGAHSHAERACPSPLAPGPLYRETHFCLLEGPAK